MIRDVTDNFALKKIHNVRVCYEKIGEDDESLTGCVVFLINPQQLSQSDMNIIVKRNICVVLVKDIPSVLKEHPLKTLLSSSSVNVYIDRIKNLKRNILDLEIIPNRKLDIWGLFASSKQLFNIDGVGYCFLEHPVIDSGELSLDKIYLSKILTDGMDYVAIASKYLKIIQDSMDTAEGTHILRNAIRDVFPFYGNEDASKDTGANFVPSCENVDFLVDVMHFEQLSSSTHRCGTLICLLAEAFSYYVHMGKPEFYIRVIEKLLVFDDEKQTIKFRYINDDALYQIKKSDLFLYFHLTNRIIGQYAIALFDDWLTECEKSRKDALDLRLENLIAYLRSKTGEFMEMPKSELWEFKKNQEIGAAFGTIGQLLLYKHIIGGADSSVYNEVERYFRNAVEYAHPEEKSRDINYLTQVKLLRTAQLGPQDGTEKDFKKIAASIGERFSTKKADDFDSLYAAQLAAAANVFFSESLSLELIKKMELSMQSIQHLMTKYQERYPSYLQVSFIIFLPPALFPRETVDTLVVKARSYFKLDDPAYVPNGIIDILSLKFMLAHSWMLGCAGGQVVEAYKKRIAASPLFAPWAQKSEEFLNNCISKVATAADAIKLMATIPY